MKTILILVLPLLLALGWNKSEFTADTPQYGQDPLIGKHFLDVRETDVNGVYHKLSDYAGKGKWVLVDFWASWCGPCREEIPYLVNAYKKYHDKGFEIVGLSFDVDKDRWMEAIASLEMPWIHLSDLKGWDSEAGKVYGIQAIPDNILIDPDGIIVARDLRDKQLEEQLAEWIKPSVRTDVLIKINDLLRNKK